MTVIELDNLSKSFGTSGVENISFECRPGSITAFLGHNGAGKTTTMRMMAGLLTPDSGTVRYDGAALHELPIPAATISFVFGPHLLPVHLRVVDYLRGICVASGAGPTLIAPTLDAVGLPTFSRRRVGNLSLGMRQRLAIAGALICRPGAVVMDEPFNGLDPEGISWLRDLLTALRNEGKTILVSTHLLREIESSTDDVVVIKNGRLTRFEALEPLVQLTSCQPVETQSFVDLLSANEIAWEQDGPTFSVRASPVHLLNLCNTARLDLHFLDAGSTSNLERVYD